MNRHLVLPLIALVFCAVLANLRHALTIYRIGGTELPPPERVARNARSAPSHHHVRSAGQCPRRLGNCRIRKVKIFDLAGRRVRRLVEQRALSTGAHTIGWDGKDAAGAVVPPGVYYARLRVDTDTEGAGISDGQVLKTIAVAY